MQLEIENLGPVERRLKIEVPTVDVDAAFAKVYQTMQKGSRIKGFRPGRAPQSVLERYFGDRARYDVLERLIRDTLPKAVSQSELAVVSEPSLEPGDPPQQGFTFAYEARVEVRPEIELARVSGLEVTRPEIPEPESDPVEAQIEQQRNAHAVVRDEDEGVQAAAGHQAVLEYEATVDGEGFPGSRGDEMLVEIGAGNTVPGFEDELLGLEIGQEKEFDITFPEDYGGEEIRGKQAHFRVRLLGLKCRELPDLDDEFAKDVSDFDTLDAFRADLRERYEKARRAEQDRRLREAVLDAAIAANPFPVPQTLVDRQLEVRLSRATQPLMQLPPEQLQSMVEEWRESWRPQAERDVQLSFLLPEVARAQGIEVSDEDVDQRLEEMAQEQGRPVDALKRSYRDQGLLEAVRGGLVEERAAEFMVSEARVSDG